MKRLLETDLTLTHIAADELYTVVQFPATHGWRPYCYINMASTLDGKIVVGDPEGTAAGVGSAMDQKLFRRLQLHCDAAIIGATTLRASHVIYPPNITRIVVTASGRVPMNNRFFTDAPDRAYIVCPQESAHMVPTLPQGGPQLILCGQQVVDFTELMRIIRTDLNIGLLLCEGGGTLNEQLLRKSLVDEIFLTLAPKLKGGAHLHTIMEGTGFPVGQYAQCRLMSVYEHEGELYLRYQILQSS